MLQQCQSCSDEFVVTDADLAFLETVSPVFAGKKELIPPPTLCPECRQQRRLMWRNERHLYRRTCDLCARSIIAMYSKHSPFTVYCPECWHSDRWDPLSIGRSYDPDRSFFEQFREVQLQAPRLSLNVVSNENSDFINLSGYNKNCYLLFAAEYDEDCMHGTQVIKSNRCIDALNCFESEACYEVTDVEKCHSLFFSRDCSNCSSSMFLDDCRGCTDCLLSTNLRNKQYVVRNEQCTREEYVMERSKITARLQTGELPNILEEFQQIIRRSIHRSASIINCENVTGDTLKNSRNCRHCFDLSYAEDCVQVYTGFQVKDLLDVCHTTDAQLGYEVISLGYGSYHVLFTHASWTGTRLLYCDAVQTGEDLFGCCGMKRNTYCILNKQYSKEEYEALVPEIIEKMKADGEYGEFFPLWMSPFAYNETTANQYFPLTQSDAEQKGFGWRTDTEETPDVTRVIEGNDLPSNIADVPDDVTQWAIRCANTGKLFKIVKPELQFYRDMQLPLPRLHPDERHRRRMALRNPRKLWDRECAKCRNPIATSYAPERPEVVYCEDCYLQEVY